MVKKFKDFAVAFQRAEDPPWLSLLLISFVAGVFVALMSPVWIDWGKEAKSLTLPPSGTYPLSSLTFFEESLDGEGLAVVEYVLDHRLATIRLHRNIKVEDNSQNLMLVEGNNVRIVLAKGFVSGHVTTANRNSGLTLKFIVVWLIGWVIACVIIFFLGLHWRDERIRQLEKATTV